jgi:type I restriction enzyme R subunit
LIERAKLLQEEDHRNKELGLSDEELAFYDILASKGYYQRSRPCSGYCGVVKAKNNLQIDWMSKEDAKASIRLSKKRIGGANIKNSTILQEIMDQAEGQYAEWRA